MTDTGPDEMERIPDSADHEANPRLPFRWEDVPHTPAGPGGYSAIRRQGAWTIELASGRKISLSVLQQGGTLDGVLAGSPRQPWFNDDIVKSAIGWAAQDLNCPPGRIFVLQPMLLRTTGKKRPKDPGPEEYPVDYLPPVRTVARFVSAPVHDPEEVGSSLVVLWHQNHYGLPTDPHLLNQLRGLDWEALAEDYGW